MKQQPDYFNHFQSMGFREIYKTPNDSKSTPKLDAIGYHFISPDYDWNVNKDKHNPYWPAPDPLNLTLPYAEPDELDTPKFIVNDDFIQTNLLYHNFNVPDVDPTAYDYEVRRDGTLKTQFYKQPVSGNGYFYPWGNPNGNFPDEYSKFQAGGLEF